MPEPSTFRDVLLKSLRAAADYSPAEETPPAAILWPDAEREWEGLLPSLRVYLPLLTVGKYEMAERTGPPAYIRCMVSRSLPGRLAPNAVPVVYLPGVSAAMLCDAGQRGRALEPLAELLYRSAVWMCRDGADWTLAEFFQDGLDGPGIELRDTGEFTRRTMRRVLPVLCNLPLAQLREEAPWRAKDFEALLGNSVSALVQMGETSELEFKSTGRWDMKEHKLNPLVEHVIVKTVGGFLNSSRGGSLLIGVEDNRQVCGIELDYELFKPTDRNPDAYERWLMTMLLNAFGHEFAGAIHPSFHTTDGKTICRVDVDPAPAPAVARFKKDGQEHEHFYLRVGNATNALGLRAFISYFRARWP